MNDHILDVERQWSYTKIVCYRILNLKTKCWPRNASGISLKGKIVRYKDSEGVCLFCRFELFMLISSESNGTVKFKNIWVRE